MKVSIIGTGNVATVLGKLFFANKCEVAQVFGRSEEPTIILATQLLAEPITNLKLLNTTADLYIIAVADKAIEEVAQQLKVANKIVVHTAGSVNKSILQTASNNYGVLYPIQSLRKDMDIKIAIPFLIDASNSSTLDELQKIAAKISDKVEVGDDDARLKLHTAAVFACNFVNYMYVQSEAICKQFNIDFALLQPLIEETALRLRQHSPKDVFTGPAVRKDMATIEKHLAQLSQNLQAKELYQQISKMIMSTELK